MTSLGRLGKKIATTYPINQRAYQLNVFTNHGAWSACRELDVVKTFVINKWKDFLLGSLYNEAIAKKRNSPFLNALTAFGEERCK